MRQVRLECEDGDKVCERAMPAFKPLPEIVTFGTRVFRLYAPPDPDDQETETVVYREVFSYNFSKHNSQLQASLEVPTAVEVSDVVDRTL